MPAPDGAFNQYWMKNWVDHDGSNRDTYDQRYWINDQYYDAETGPIFLYLCGEWTCQPPSVDGAAF